MHETSAAAVEVRDLVKTFRVPVREAGLGQAVKSLFKREFRTVEAVAGISFSVDRGEMVGFLGPNGAGKTTTLKMLAGLLYPTSGEASVLGCRPWDREHAFLRRIGMVAGNRRQLAWDVPAVDSYETRRAIYGIERARFRTTLEELIDRFGIGDLVTKPVRNLSLGERMKVELVGVLLHQPELLFLDEPTIGLDVSTQTVLREFIADYNRRTGAAVMLTSHYMADIEALTERVVVIADGRLIHDGLLSDLTDRFSVERRIDVTLAEPADLSIYGEVASEAGPKVSLRVARAQAAGVTARLFAEQSVVDLTVEDPPIEETIEALFEGDGRNRGDSA